MRYNLPAGRQVFFCFFIQSFLTDSQTKKGFSLLSAALHQFIFLELFKQAPNFVLRNPSQQPNKSILKSYQYLFCSLIVQTYFRTRQAWFRYLLGVEELCFVFHQIWRRLTTSPCEHPSKGEITQPKVQYNNLHNKS